MSYYSQQNLQQKSAGLFIVIAFHVILITVLAKGLMPNLTREPPPEPIILKDLDKPVVKPIDPIVVNVTERTIFTNQPTPLPPIDQSQIEPQKPLIDQPQIITTETTGVVITRASIKRAPKPEYPTTSTRFNEQGTTGMRVSIDPTGHVTNAVVVSSSGYERLDQAAVKHAMRNWLFNPCTENGKAVSCDQNVKLTWKLEEAR